MENTTGKRGRSTFNGSLAIEKMVPTCYEPVTRIAQDMASMNLQACFNYPSSRFNGKMIYDTFVKQYTEVLNLSEVATQHTDIFGHAYKVHKFMYTGENSVNEDTEEEEEDKEVEFHTEEDVKENFELAIAKLLETMQANDTYKLLAQPVTDALKAANNSSILFATMSQYGAVTKSRKTAAVEPKVYYLYILVAQDHDTPRIDARLALGTKDNSDISTVIALYKNYIMTEV
jgi:hypothetical protein